MLSTRQESILKIIVREYVSTATPVGSESIARRHRLGVSPATIRNEMAVLEEGGYIAHPHTSAGRTPLDKGYRYYVEWLMDDAELPLDEQRMIRHQFHQVGSSIEEWMRLAGAILCRMAGNVAIVTQPKAAECRLKRLELVALEGPLVLVIVVLRDAKLVQRMLAVEGGITQEELSTVAALLNAVYSGLSASQIRAKRAVLSPVEERVTEAVAGLMQAEDEAEYKEPYLDGLCHMLRQPEFSSSQMVRAIIEALEQGSALRDLLSQVLIGEGVKVIVGGENRQDAMRQCSVVITRYGIPLEASGAIGVVGPTRMPYGRTISMVRYLASLMDELLAEVYGFGILAEDQGVKSRTLRG